MHALITLTENCLKQNNIHWQIVNGKQTSNNHRGQKCWNLWSKFIPQFDSGPGLLTFVLNNIPVRINRKSSIQIMDKKHGRTTISISDEIKCYQNLFIHVRKLTNYQNKNSLKCEISHCKNVNECLFFFFFILDNKNSEWNQFWYHNFWQQAEQ